MSPIGTVAAVWRTLASSLLPVGLLLAVASCGSETTDNPDPGTAFSLVDEDCPGEAVPTRLTVSCHRLHLDHGTLGVAVLWAEDPTGLPVLHLHGGPGGRAVADRYRWLVPRSQVLEGHDVVLVDQRGGGTSTPSLDCPELDDPATPPGEAIQACRYRLDQKGVDRGSVTVGSTAADLVHLRRSLGIDAWHLHGVSSGTRIALELLRIDGSSVASAVLDSPTPPEVDLYDDLPEGVLYALTSMENLCRADATCPGGLVGPLRSILDDLADRPVAVTIWSGEASAYDDARLIRLVADALAAPAGLNVVDGAVALAAEGRLAEAIAALNEVASTGRSVGDPTSEGARLSSECADELPFNDADPMLTGDPILDAVARGEVKVRALCAVWQVERSPDIVNWPMVSDVPTLILSGHLDPITPTAWARRLADRLGNAVLVESERWAHAPSMSDPCAAHLVARFLDGERPLSGFARC
ncbi:MAG: alpha/beta fold hydrolase [Acidimicrobiales bacterium]|nr:alpha/beta fold hydrolase [Acidimicrobiales bacterium]